MKRRGSSLLGALASALALAAGGCARGSPAAPPRAPTVAPPAVAPTAALLEVLHESVRVFPAASGGAAVQPRSATRVEVGGRAVTAADGRAVLRMDNGLELRLDGDTEVRLLDGRARLERGRAFASAWGDDERALEVGDGLALTLGDTALELERGADGSPRVIAVRGEAAWRAGDRQGRLQQGEALGVRSGVLTQRASGVWDDWTGGAASPQGAAHRSALGAGVAVMHGAAGEAPTPLAVNEEHVAVEIQGDLAVTTVTQRFFNGSSGAAPVEYRVRLPAGALVSRFAAGVNGALVLAVPGAVAELADNGSGLPALLAAPDGSLFARMETVAPGASLHCVLTYAEWLPRAEGRRTYTFPLGDPVAPTFVGEFDFALTAQRAHVSALRAPAGAALTADGVRYARSDFRPRGDLYVELFDDDAPALPAARLWLSTAAFGESGQYALADVTLPAPEDQGTDLVVLLDTSAATDPGALAVASAAVDALLRQLGPRDRLKLMFGDLTARAASGAAGELTAVSPARRDALVAAVARAQPGGATDLGRMLADAATALDPRRNGAVLYLGDATPTLGPLDGEALADAVLRAAPDLRLYVMALGADAHPEVLSALTRRGGLTVRASDQGEAVAAAQTLAAHATRPVLRDVTVDLGPGVARPLPAAFEQYVLGDPLQVYGELEEDAPREITVRARLGREPRTWTIAPRSEIIRDGGDIRRRWGLARLRALELDGGSAGALADLGTRFGLLTPSSALVLDRAAGAEGQREGYRVAAGLWPVESAGTRLPRLDFGAGNARSLAPRGVRELFAPDEFPMVADAQDGWQPHFLGEGAEQQQHLSTALALAAPDARACVARARALRPGLSGSVTITARVLADGHVTAAKVDGTSLFDAGAEGCIRRAVASLVVPAPELLNARPEEASYTFEFPPAATASSGRGCPPTSRLDRTARAVLWRERLRESPPLTLWQDALARCELRLWEDRAAMLDLLVRAVPDPVQLADVRRVLEDDGVAYLDRAVARRFGPSRMFRAYLASATTVNWDALLRKLMDPAVPMARKIEMAQAYARIAPRDMDLRLRLMALYEQAGRTAEARHAADLLRRDPGADARVRALVGELYFRTGDRAEGLRALTEIAEIAPYDAGARAQLGDLLLTYGGAAWAEPAYAQYRTLAALRPGDPLARVRQARAARAAGRTDEALRLLRAASEEAGDDATERAAQALLALELGQLAVERGADPAVAAWTRVAALLPLARAGGVVLDWTHPGARLSLRAQQAGDNEFVEIDPSAPLPVRVFSPGTALEGSRVLVRADGGVAGARTVTARVTLVRPGAGAPTLVTREVTLSAAHPLTSLLVQNGALLADPTALPASEQPAPTGETY